MDMFYAAVEIRNNPLLADKPVAVGDYSMISTANYIARKYGVRSAMPGFIGKKLCPDLVFVSYSRGEYSKVSGEVMDILKEYDTELEVLGLDKAALDVTEYLEVKGDVNDYTRLQLAQEIQQRIFEKVKLTASCGVAANKMLAKIACDMKKPNGTMLAPFDSKAIEELMIKLSLRKIPGIGPVNEQLLNGLGFNSCGDILQRITTSTSYSLKTTLNSMLEVL
jgi:DNA polymerase kappa